MLLKQLPAKAGRPQGLGRRWGANRRIRLRGAATQVRSPTPGTPYSLSGRRTQPKARNRPGRRADDEPGQAPRKERQRREPGTNRARPRREAGRASAGARRGLPGWPAGDRAEPGVRLNGMESPSSGARGPLGQPSHHG